jgi:hypothetical protein
LAKNNKNIETNGESKLQISTVWRIRTIYSCNIACWNFSHSGLKLHIIGAWAVDNSQKMAAHV